MNKPETVSTSQSVREEVIDLTEIIKEDEEKNADVELMQQTDTDIIELHDALAEPEEHWESVADVAQPVGRASESEAVTDIQSAAERSAMSADEQLPDCGTTCSGSTPELCHPSAPESSSRENSNASEAVEAQTVTLPKQLETASDETSGSLREQLCSLEERLVQLKMENDTLRLRLDEFDRTFAEKLERGQRYIALLEDRIAALEEVPQISLDSVQAAMDSLSSQLNSSLEVMQGKIDAVQQACCSEAALGDLAAKLEPVIDKSAAQAAARIIREELSRLMAEN